jgi:hypothetical protein
MAIVNVLGQHSKNSVMFDTWGHMYPEPSSKHVGYIIFADSCYREQSIVDSSFETLQDSPMRFRLEQDVFDMFETETGVYRVDCTLWFFKGVHDAYLGEPIGKIIKATCIPLVLSGITA